MISFQQSTDTIHFMLNKDHLANIQNCVLEETEIQTAMTCKLLRNPDTGK